MADELRRYPTPPPGEPGPPDAPDPRTDPRFYHVVQGDEVVAAYDSAHDPSPEAVIGDLLARCASGEVAGTSGEPHVIWRAGRRLAVIRRGVRGERPVAPDPPPGEGESPGRVRLAESIRDDYRAA